MIVRMLRLAVLVLAFIGGLALAVAGFIAYLARGDVEER